MITINKYEAFGIGFSVCAMSLALFVMQFNNTFGNAPKQGGQQQMASLIMADGTDGIGSALSSAMSGNKVNSIVATDVVIGNGKEVSQGDSVRINYIATLQNGQEFDNTYKKGSAFSFKVGDSKVISGLNEGVLGMKNGGQRILVIPSDRAFGANGYGPVPKNATVVYAVELVEVK